MHAVRDLEAVSIRLPYASVSVDVDTWRCNQSVTNPWQIGRDLRERLDTL
jgi:hypothetical protein